jgi:hypothetical protein
MSTTGTSGSASIGSSPGLFFEKPTIRPKTKRQSILDLIGDSAAGITRIEIAGAVGSSPPNSVSVAIMRINEELVGQGWKVTSTNIERQKGRRGAPGRRYRLVRL